MAIAENRCGPTADVRLDDFGDKFAFLLGDRCEARQGIPSCVQHPGCITNDKDLWMLAQAKIARHNHPSQAVMWGAKPFCRRRGCNPCRPNDGSTFDSLVTYGHT